jgi:hypothetical protein
MNCVALEIILTGRKVPAEECLNDGAPIAANRAWKERPGLLGAALENAFRNSGKTREQGEPRNVMVAQCAAVRCQAKPPPAGSE